MPEQATAGSERSVDLAARLLATGHKGRYGSKTRMNISSRWQRCVPTIDRINGKAPPEAYRVMFHNDSSGGFDYIAGVNNPRRPYRRGAMDSDYEGEKLMNATQAVPKVVSRDEWIDARKALLFEEKKHTWERDALSARRRLLPWVKVEKAYVFAGPNGPVTLADLFEGRSQLIVYHFMFGPEWKEGCIGCSLLADHVDGARAHLESRDVAFVAVSRAPLAKLDAFKKRMGWSFRWVSSSESDFNFDYRVSFTAEEIAKGTGYYNYQMGGPNSEEMSGTSVFYKDDAGDIFHTYSTYARGDEGLLGVYTLLDFTPKGRDETGPNGDLSDWVRHHDKYDAAPKALGCGFGEGG